MEQNKNIELNWVGKKESTVSQNHCCTNNLIRNSTLSYGQRSSPNMLIHGESLDVLNILNQKFHQQIKCIYIDPPYNTGSDFELYDDDIGHAQWLSFMRARLVVLYELLSLDGVIFVQIDDHEMAYLQLIMDEIFGRNNRINTICVKMSEASGVKMSHVAKRLPKIKEYILCYRRSEEFRFANILNLPRENWNHEYKLFLENYTIEIHCEIKDILRKNHFDSSDVTTINHLLKNVRFGSVSQKYKELMLQNKSEQESWCIKNAWRIVQAVGSSSVKRYADLLEKQEQDIGALLSPTGIMYLYRCNYNKASKQPRVQILYAEDHLSYHPGDFWSDIKTTGGVGQEGGILFPNGKKPEKLIERILNMATKNGDWVLDCFLGSGTTAAVAHKMERHWIGIEKSSHIKTHARQRLVSVVDGEQSGISAQRNWTGGNGFQFYEISSPQNISD